MEKEKLSYGSFTLVEIMIVIAIPVFPAPRTSPDEIRWNNP